MKNGVNKMNFLCSEIKEVNIGDKIFTIKTKEDERKTKGYLFDSLVYRYIRAREHMAECEYLRDQMSANRSHRHHDWITYSTRANRDIARFIDLLNEAMGEHD